MADITRKAHPTHLATNQPMFETVLSDSRSSQKKSTLSGMFNTSNKSLILQFYVKFNKDRLSFHP